jgi:hypothetical protein
MTEQKYDHRLVGRNNLSDLEAAVTELAEDGWEVENPDHGPTIGQVLAQTTNPHGVGVTLPIGVGMRKPVSEEELERRLLERQEAEARAKEIARLEAECDEFRKRIDELSQQRTRYEEKPPE